MCRECVSSRLTSASLKCSRCTCSPSSGLFPGSSLTDYTLPSVSSGSIREPYSTHRHKQGKEGTFWHRERRRATHTPISLSVCPSMIEPSRFALLPTLIRSPSSLKSFLSSPCVCRHSDNTRRRREGGGEGCGREREGRTGSPKIHETFSLLHRDVESGVRSAGPPYISVHELTCMYVVCV